MFKRSHNRAVLRIRIETVTPLLIRAGDAGLTPTAADLCCVRTHHAQHGTTVYIPGSSLKGKMRSLLEWRSGAVKEAALGWSDYENAPAAQQAEVKRILQLFGISGDAKLGMAHMGTLGPTRVSFWDCNLNAEWEKQIREDNFALTEVKSENRINRISGVAEHPRQTERVPAGSLFDFRLSIKLLDIDGDGSTLQNTVLAGLRLLELDSLGGSGSRGYGKLKFRNLRLDGADIQARFDALDPFAGVTA